jgi:multiple sugar transport system ATP-binding protein
MFVAGFIGSPSMNFCEADLVQSNGDLVVDTGDFTVTVPEDRRPTYGDAVGKGRVVFGIRPEDMHDPAFLPPGVDQSVIKAEVDVVELMGNEIFVYLKVGDQTLIARVDPRTSFRVGDSVEIAINMGNMHLFEKDTEQAVAQATLT